MKLIINRVIKEWPKREFNKKNGGKGYINSANVDASVDGRDLENIQVSCIFYPVWKRMQEGAEFECEETDSYKGQRQFRLSPDNKEVTEKNYKKNPEPTARNTPNGNAGHSYGASQMASFARSYAKDIVVAMVTASKEQIGADSLIEILDRFSNANLHWLLTFSKDGADSSRIAKYVAAKNGVADVINYYKLDDTKIVKELVDAQFDEAIFTRKLEDIKNGNALPM